MRLNGTKTGKTIGILVYNDLGPDSVIIGEIACVKKLMKTTNRELVSTPV